jgi:hypothetical protein
MFLSLHLILLDMYHVQVIICLVLNSFSEQLTHEQEKLLYMGALDTGFKQKALFVHKNKDTKPSK